MKGTDQMAPGELALASVPFQGCAPHCLEVLTREKEYD